MKRFRMLWSLLVICQVSEAASRWDLREGDILFQTSRSAQSQAIQAATHSHYSHIGIVRKEAGKLLVVEASGRVKYTPLGVWIQHGEGRHFVAKRLNGAESILSESAKFKLRFAEEQWRGRPYDAFFNWSDDRMYCSELVWKVYKQALAIELGSLHRLREFDLQSPIVQRKLKERYGSAVPLEEPVIAPSDIFNSEKLVEVYQQ